MAPFAVAGTAAATPARECTLRILITLLAIIALGALAAPSQARIHVIPAADASRTSVTFDVRGLGAGQRIMGARVVARGVRRSVRIRTVRRGVRRGMLRVTLKHRRTKVRAAKLVVNTRRRPRKDTETTDGGTTGGDTTTGESGSAPATTTSTTCSLGTFSYLTMPGGCWRPYADTSLFNRAIPANPRLVPNSSAMVRRMTAGGTGGPWWAAGEAGTEDDFDHPIYYSQPTDPVYTVDCVEDWGDCRVEGEQIRIPARARPAAGGDGHLAVIDQARGIEYDFWQVQTPELPAGGGHFKVTWGGKTTMAAGAQDGLHAEATAAGFGLAAGIVRGPEMQAREINHALFITTYCTNGKRVGGADGIGRECTRAGESATDAPAMGQHFVLDMSEAEIAGLQAPEWSKTILRAMARYGLIIGDTGGSSWGIGIKPESGQSYLSFGNADPWVEFAKQVGVPSYVGSDGARRYKFDMRTTVDWASRLKAIDPCYDTGTCQ